MNTLTTSLSKEVSIVGFPILFPTLWASGNLSNFKRMVLLSYAGIGKLVDYVYFNSNSHSQPIGIETKVFADTKAPRIIRSDLKGPSQSYTEKMKLVRDIFSQELADYYYYYFFDILKMHLKWTPSSQSVMHRNVHYKRMNLCVAARFYLKLRLDWCWKKLEVGETVSLDV